MGVEPVGMGRHLCAGDGMTLTATACAFPGCPNGRVSWARVDRPRGAELLPVCGRHRVACDADPALAVRVWACGRAQPPRPHVDAALVEGLVREVRRRQVATRGQLLEWAARQALAGSDGPYAARTDALAALDALVRNGRLRQRAVGPGASREADEVAYRLTEGERNDEAADEAAEPTTTPAATAPEPARAETERNMSMRQEAVAYIAAHPGVETGELAKVLGVKSNSISAALCNLRTAGRVRSEDGEPPPGGGRPPSRWWVVRGVPAAVAPTAQPEQPTAIAEIQAEVVAAAPSGEHDDAVSQAMAILGCGDDEDIRDRARNVMGTVGELEERIRALEGVEATQAGWLGGVDRALQLEGPRHDRQGARTSAIYDLRTRVSVAEQAADEAQRTASALEEEVGALRRGIDAITGEHPTDDEQRLSDVRYLAASRDEATVGQALYRSRCAALDAALDDAAQLRAALAARTDELDAVRAESERRAADLAQLPEAYRQRADAEVEAERAAEGRKRAERDYACVVAVLGIDDDADLPDVLACAASFRSAAARGAR